MEFLPLFLLFLFNIKLCSSLTEIYIGDRSLPVGTGSVSSPYNNLATSFSQTAFLPNEIYFLILTTSFLTITDQDIDPVAVNLSLYDSGRRYSLLKNSSVLNVTLIPLDCYQNHKTDNFTSCANKSTISFKSERAFFYVSGTLNLINIVLRGIDLPLTYSSATDSSCFFTSECCDSSALYSSSLMSGRCFIQNKIVSRSNKNFANYSIFIITSNNSLLNLYNSELSDFYAINTTKSFGFFVWTLQNVVNSTVVFNQTLLNNTYFLYGFLKNSYLNVILKSGVTLNYNNLSIREYSPYSYQLMNHMFDVSYAAILVDNVSISGCINVFRIFGSQMTMSNSIWKDVYNGNPIIPQTYMFIFAENHANVIVMNTTFTNNVFQYYSTQFTYIYLNNYVNLTFANSIFNNTETNNHRIFYFNLNNTLTFANSTISNMNGSSKPQSLCFTLNRGNSLSLNDSLISNLYVSGNGGVFYFSSGWNSLVLSNVSLQGLFYLDSDSSKGAVFYFSTNIQSNNLWVNMSNFCNVSMRNGTGLLMVFDTTGSAYYSQSNVTLINSTFKNFVTNGTVIKPMGSITQLNFIVNITFTFLQTEFLNISTQSGLIEYESSNGTVILIQCIFDNITGYQGVVLYSVVTVEIVMVDIMVRNVYGQAYGGVLVLSFLNLTLKNSIFMNCGNTNDVGGVAWFNSFLTFSLENLYLMNIITGDVGAIFWTNNIKCDVINVTMTNLRTLSPSQTSAGFYILILNNITFFNCVFENAYSDSAGLIEGVNLNNIIIYHSFFFNCSAMDNGGVFMLETNNTLNITQSYFIQCSGYNGGVFYISDYNQIFLSELTFEYNYGVNGGVIYCNLACNFSIDSSSFMLNSVTNLGGDVYFSQSGYLSLTNTTFNGSYSSISAGSFYLDSLNLINISNCSFLKISSGNSIGVFQASSKNNIFFSNILLNDILLSSEVGFLYLDDSNNVSISYLTFDTFSSSGAGFLDAFQNNLISTENLQLKNGVSSTGSGLITLYSNNTLQMMTTNISNVTSSGEGGGFQFYFQNYVQINDSIISSVGSVLKAGIFWLSNNNVLSIYGTIILSAHSLQFYGAVFWAKVSNIVSFYDVTIDGASSRDSGGVAYLQLFNTLNINFSRMYNSTTGNSGGGLFYSSYSNTIDVSNSNVSNVSASSYGGVANLETTSTISFYNVTFSQIGVSLEYGGFLFAWQGNQISIKGCKFLEINFPSGYYGIFFYLSGQNNLSLRESLVNSSNTSNQEGNFIFSYQQNFVNISDLTLKIGFCFSLFYITQDSVVFLDGIILDENLEAMVVFYVSDSNMTIKNSTTRLKVHFNMFAGFNASIRVIDYDINPFFNETLSFTDIPAYYQENISVRGVVLLDSSSLLLNNGRILMQNLVKTSSGITITGGVLKIFKTSFFNFQTDSSNNAISLTSLSILSIQYSLFFLNRVTGKSGGVFVINYPTNINFTITVLYSNFFFNSAERDSGCFYVSSNESNSFSSLLFKNVKFQANRALNAGVMKIINPPTSEIENCLLMSNRAVNWASGNRAAFSEDYMSSKGGAFYFSTDNSSKAAIIDFKNNSFKNNMADIGGVVYHEGPINIENLKDSSISNSNNNAIFFGGFIASETRNIYFLDALSTDLSVYDTTIDQLYNVISGYTYNPCLGYIVGIDAYSQMTIMNNENLLSSLKIINSSQIVSTLNFTSIYNQICISGPFTRDSRPIQATKNYIISLEGQEEAKSLFFQLNYRSCALGERLADNLSCIECLRGEYLFVSDPNELTPYCYPCGDATPFNCFGGNRLTPKPGYWRRDATSLNFLECTQLNCLGDNRDMQDPLVGYNEIYAQGLCAEHYKGVMCGECAEGYGKAGDEFCDACSDFSYFGVILFFTLSKLLFSLLCTHFILNMGLDMIEAEGKTLATKRNVMVASLLKAWINYIETMSTLLYFPVKWSDVVQKFLKYFFLFSLKVGDTLPLECLINSLGFNIKVLYFKLLLATIYPIIIMIIDFGYLVLLTWFKKKKNDKKLRLFFLKTKQPYKDYIPLVFFSVILLSYSDIMRVCLEMVQYIDIGDSNGHDLRLVSDSTVVFESDEYYTWFFSVDFPLFFFYGAFFPLVISIYLLYKHFKKTLFQSLTLLKFSIFYYTFNKKLLFWELVIFFRKALLVFIQLYTFSSSGYRDMYPIISIMGVLLFATALQTYFRPFQTQFDDLNKVEFGSLLSLVVIFYLGIFYSLPVLAGTVIPDYYHYLFVLLGAGTNLAFLAKFLEVLWKCLVERKEKQKKSLKLLESILSSENKGSILMSRFAEKETKSDKMEGMHKISLGLGFGGDKEESIVIDKIKKPSLTSTEDQNKTALNLVIPQPFGQSQLRPLSVIDEMISQEKIHRTFIDLNATARTNYATRFQNETLKNLFKWTFKQKASHERLIDDNKSLWKEICKAGNQDENDESNSIFEYYSKEREKELGDFKPAGFNFILSDGNEMFYDACQHNDQIFAETSQFKLRGQYNFIRGTNSLIAGKLVITFTSKLEIMEFEINVLKNEEIAISINPQVKTSPDKKEKTVEAYLLPIAIVTQPPKAAISCSFTKKKNIKISFKLPVLINRFLILQEIPNEQEFKALMLSDQLTTILKKNISNTSRKKIACFEDLKGFFESHVVLEPQKLVGQMQMINLEWIVIYFEIEYLENKEEIQLDFEFKIQKKLEEKENERREILGKLAEKIGETFEKFFADFE